MTVSAGQLNRATLARQLLLRRESLSVPEAISRVVALQAQEPASPYIALWTRLDGFDPTDLDAAFAEHTVLKASLMRITLHAVHADDYPKFHEAMQRTLRASRLHDDRFKVAGLSIADADALIPELLAFAAEPRSNAELEAWLDDRLGVLPRPGLWWAIRTYGPFVHAPIGATWSFGPRPAYVAAPRQERPGDWEASVQRLVRRYLEGFGPATVADAAQFMLIQRSFVRAALSAMADELVRHEGPDGAELWDVPDAPLPDADTPAPPRLLPMWDSIVLAYSDRSRIVPDAYRRVIGRSNGDTLATVLVDGHVRGVWRALDEGIEVTAFERLPPEAWQALEAEARSLCELLADREPQVYRRYARWWSALPSAQTRILGA